MKPQLVVARDIAAAAAERFLQIAPRTVALAGGSTPRRLYQRLAGCAFPWPETDVFFGDERCVPADHAGSNFRMASEALLASVSAKVHRMCGESCAAAAYETELRAVFGDRLPAFDLVLLGLGEDGHTASLFPDDAALQERKRWVVRVERPDYARMTLTLPVLSAAQTAIFLVAGAAKREALRQLLAGGEIPAARVQAKRIIVIADEEAAERTA